MAKKNKETMYEGKIKHFMDKSLSFAGMVILSPVFLVISLAIWMDDPGAVLFTQERVGKGKKLFTLHKFRTMKRSTPHDVPTHQLSDPEQYITRIGKFLRKYSLDELPQIWDIFVGNMSIIGPRPALWNQDDLVAERDKYGANDVLPGLTGWAQINGRDELEIPEKAKLDGVYVEKLKRGGGTALFFDVWCFLGTIFSVIGGDGVIEGGTGELHKEKDETLGGTTAADVGFADYGYLKRFNIDMGENNQKRILITGAGSYIGESFKKWAEKHYPVNFEIDTLDMINPSWREKDFSLYDVVFHVAGIAHADVGKVSVEEKKKYYAVNTDLAVETAKKAKAEGIKQFVLMSSMIIYGDSAPYGKEKVIDVHTLPAPANFYGDSKWQADKGVRKLADEKFRVAVLRPPMIYGKGSKGNYRTLAKLAKKLSMFPDAENRRSMLYVGNLCEFLCKLMLSGEGGVYFPQNGEYTKTAEMVKEIAEAAGKNIWVTKLLNPAVVAGSYIPGKISRLVNKAFGSCVYDQKLSRYEGLEYQIVDLQDSIWETGSVQRIERRKKKGVDSRPCLEQSKEAVLILVNHDVVIYNFRLELVEKLLAEGYEVHISSPYGERIDELVQLGTKYHEIEIDRHGMNPKADLQIFFKYKRLMKNIRPMVVLTYTIKPNVYGGVAAKMEHIPFIANVTGLGTALNQGEIRERLILLLYRIGLYGARKVFFQNERDKDFMLNRHIISKSCSCEVIPGSGVNLNTHNLEPYPKETDRLIFTTIGRIMHDKGTDELISAAGEIKKKDPHIIFRLIGFFDGDYEAKIRDAKKDGIIEYIGQQRNIHSWLKETHAVIHASYHEGMSNVLLEAASTGRPVIATNVPGCRETFEEGITGIGFESKNSEDLIRAVREFISLPHTEKEAMGREGRRKMEREFSRDIVVGKYMAEINKIKENRKDTWAYMKN